MTTTIDFAVHLAPDFSLPKNVRTGGPARHLGRATPLQRRLLLHYLPQKPRRA